MTAARSIDWDSLGPPDLLAWQALAVKVNAAPDLWPAWAEALIEAHHIPSREIRVLVLEDHSGWRGLIPLHVSRSRRWGADVEIVEPLQSKFSLHFDLLSDLEPDQVARGFFDALAERLPRWDGMILNGLVRDGALARALEEAAGERRLLCESTYGDSSPYLRIDGRWEDYLAGKSANFRSNLKRKARKLREAGETCITFVTEPRGVADALDVIQAIDDKSWKANSGTAITSRTWESRFYRALCVSFSRTEQVLITLASFNGQAIAFDMTLLGGNKGYCLKTSFDAAYGELSAGLVLRAELMQRLFASAIEEYDFLGKNERYKLEWAETVRQAQSMRLLNTKRPIGWLWAAASRLRNAWHRRKAAWPRPAPRPAGDGSGS